jgi:VWFA-related protein
MRRRALLRDLGLGCTILAAASASVTVRAAPQAPQQFRAAVDVVEVTVTVTDEDGRPVSNLTREDFTILDEGRPQAISVFGRMGLALPSPPVAEGRPRRVWPAGVTTNDVAPEGRVFALILDDQLTQPVRTLSVRRLAREFVEQYVGPADLVGVFSTGGRGVLTQEFTNDKTRVLTRIEGFWGTGTCGARGTQAFEHLRGRVEQPIVGH